MNVKMLKSKKTITVVVISVLVLILMGILIYFNFINREKETSIQPININESVEQNLNEKVNNSNEIKVILENVVDDNKENKIDNKNVKDNTKNNTNTNANTNTTPYYIKVNYGAQVVTVYGKDANGEYTVPVKAMVCSTGTDTPRSGVYSIPGRWKWGALFGNVYGQYCIKITGNILFHSVPYLRKGDNASLEYWEYDKLGTAASAGCVRLTVADVIWLYNNCANGTKVEFYSSSNPGPLGKPSAKKISSYSDNLRNWDPTDPNPNNPWKTYEEPQESENENNIEQPKPTVTMPNLIGLDITQSEKKLTELGLKYNVKLITSLSDNTVFYQSVQADTNKTASEYEIIIIKCYKKVEQVETKVNVVNSSNNADYIEKDIKLVINNKELNGTFNGNSYIGTSTVNIPNVLVEIYIDNILVKSQDFNLDSIAKSNESSSTSVSLTVNI